MKTKTIDRKTLLKNIKPKTKIIRINNIKKPIKKYSTSTKIKDIKSKFNDKYISAYNIIQSIKSIFKTMKHKYNVPYFSLKYNQNEYNRGIYKLLDKNSKNIIQKLFNETDTLLAETEILLKDLEQITEEDIQSIDKIQKKKNILLEYKNKWDLQNEKDNFNQLNTEFKKLYKIWNLQTDNGKLNLEKKITIIKEPIKTFRFFINLKFINRYINLENYSNVNIDINSIKLLAKNKNNDYFYYVANINSKTYIIRVNWDLNNHKIALYKIHNKKNHLENIESNTKKAIQYTLSKLEKKRKFRESSLNIHTKDITNENPKDAFYKMLLLKEQYLFSNKE